LAAADCEQPTGDWRLKTYNSANKAAEQALAVPGMGMDMELMAHRTCKIGYFYELKKGLVVRY